MTFTEAQICFEKEVLGIWTNWTPTEAEQSFWILSLQGHTEANIKKALFRYAQKYELYNKPKLPLFLEIINSFSFPKKNQEQEFNPLFWLVREKDGVMKPIYGRAGKYYSPDQISRIAETTRQKWCDTYNTNWFVVQNREHDLAAQYPNHRYPVIKKDEEEAKEPLQADEDFFEQEAKPFRKIDGVEKIGNIIESIDINPDYNKDYVPPKDEIPF